MENRISFEVIDIIRYGNQYIREKTKNPGVFPVSSLPEILNCQTPEEVWSVTLDGDTYDHEMNLFLPGADLTKQWCCLLDNKNLVMFDEIDMPDFIIEIINQETGWNAFVEWMNVSV